MFKFTVTFQDLEIDVVAADREGAQELAIEQAEELQGYSTAIVRIRRV